MFASKSTGGFYDLAIHVSMPRDVVEITAEAHAALMVGQGQGKIVGWSDDGFPLLIDPPVPSSEYFAEVERSWRDLQLAATDGVVARHRDELEASVETTLSPDQYTELQVYRRALRNWPEAGQFPLIDRRPITPPWLSDLL